AHRHRVACPHRLRHRRTATPVETRERFPARGDGTTPAPGGPVMRALLPLATLVCLLMSLPLLCTLVLRDGWWVPAVVLMVSVTAVSALYRLTGWNSAPVMPLQILAVLLLMTPMFAAHTAPLGIIPTGGSVTYL